MPNERKRRSLTSEMMLWIFLLVVIPLLLLSGYFYFSITSALKETARENELHTNQVAQRSIEALGETILGVTITNGYWEDNRQALLAHDMDWLELNIGDMVNVVPNIDFVAETDLQGNVIVQRGDVEQFMGRLKNPVILERFQREKEFFGILVTSKGAAIIAVSQVTGDNGENGSSGLLITGRLLKDEILLRLKDTLQTDIALLLESGQFLSSSKGITPAELKPFLAGNSAENNESFAIVARNDVSVSQSASGFKDMAGQGIGVIFTESQSRTAAKTTQGLSQMALYSLIVMAFLLLLVSFLLRRRVMLPLRHLTRTLEQVAAGRHVDEIPKHVKQADVELLQAISRIGSLNQDLERTVEKRTAAIQNLLSYARQGFFTIHSDLLVSDEYSVQCRRIFSRDIARAYLPKLIYPHDERELQLFKDILEECFNQNDDLKRESIVSLLPDELLIGEFTVSVEYKVIVDQMNATSEMMVILTDITEKRMIEQQMAQERCILQMVVQVVTHLDEFNEIVSEFTRFCEMGIVDTMNGRMPMEQRLLSVYKRIHTFKGSFSFLQFLHILPRLHELETRIQERIAQADSYTDEQHMDFLRSLGLQTWMKDDLQILINILGERMLFRNQRAQDIAIERKDWIALEKELTQALTESGHQELSVKLRKLRNKPLRDMVQGYADYLADTSDRLGIKLHPMRIEGEDVSVDAERFREFSQSLIHVFRNIIVHAIEPPEERQAQGKDESGQVTLSTRQVNDRIVISIEDDGRGIDVLKLRKRLVEKGLFDESSVFSMPDEEIISSIFLDELTTTESVSELSGRGVGLSAVKDGVDKVHGTVEVKSVPGRGTTFIFTIPLEDQIYHGEGLVQ